MSPFPLTTAGVVLGLAVAVLIAYRLGDMEGRAVERHEEFERTLADVVHLASDADLAAAVGLLTAEVERRLRARGIEPDGTPDDQGRDDWRSSR